MKNCQRYVILAVVCLPLVFARAQTNVSSYPPTAKDFTTPAPEMPAGYTNKAVVPVPRPDPKIQGRVNEVLKLAKDNPGPCDIVFIGDSITQGWLGNGKNVWKKYYGNRKVLNFGVSGDRTEHVLWRFEHGQLDGVKPKVAVVMIGTNNSGYTESDILGGVVAIVDQIRQRLPDTKILLLAIFPRGQQFNLVRGKLLEVNEALAKLDDGNTISYLDIGPQLIESDGSITKKMMSDALHPNEPGYEIWASAMEPKLKEWLGE